MLGSQSCRNSQWKCQIGAHLKWYCRSTRRRALLTKHARADGNITRCWNGGHKLAVKFATSCAANSCRHIARSGPAWSNWQWTTLWHSRSPNPANWQQPASTKTSAGRAWSKWPWVAHFQVRAAQVSARNVRALRECARGHCCRRRILARRCGGPAWRCGRLWKGFASLGPRIVSTCHGM